MNEQIPQNLQILIWLWLVVFIPLVLLALLRVARLAIRSKGEEFVKLLLVAGEIAIVWVGLVTVVTTCLFPGLFPQFTDSFFLYVAAFLGALILLFYLSLTFSRRLGLLEGSARMPMELMPPLRRFKTRWEKYESLEKRRLIPSYVKDMQTLATEVSGELLELESKSGTQWDRDLRAQIQEISDDLWEFGGASILRQEHGIRLNDRMFSYAIDLAKRAYEKTRAVCSEGESKRHRRLN
jgi:hypothetical protein